MSLEKVKPVVEKKKVATKTPTPSVTGEPNFQNELINEVISPSS